MKNTDNKTLRIVLLIALLAVSAFIVYEVFARGLPKRVLVIVLLGVGVILARTLLEGKKQSRPDSGESEDNRENKGPEL